MMFTKLRPLEVALLAFVGLSVAWNYYLIIPAKAVAVMHWIIETPRWQMVPAYVATVLLAFWPLSANSLAYIILEKTILVLLVGSAVIAYLIPLFVLPSLSGPWKVGTTDIESVDNSRPMWMDDQEAQRRRIRAQLWYPTQDEQGARAPYWPNLEMRGPAAAKVGNQPWFVFNHLNLIKARATIEAYPAAQRQSKPFPVIVFSHGYTGSPYLSTMLCEDLASHGYLVVAVEHPCDSTMTVFRDGSTMPFRGVEGFPEQMEAKRLYRRKQATIRFHDVKHILDILEKLNGEDPTWRGKIDLDRIGVMGHSFGGCTAILAAYEDPRVKACVGLDAWLWPLPELLTEPEAPSGQTVEKPYIAKPVMLLDAPCFFTETEEHHKHNRRHADTLLGRCEENSLKVVIAGSRHHDYVDIGFMAPLFTGLLKLTGFPDGYLMQRLMLDFSLAFFGDRLLDAGVIGSGPSLDKLRERYPQVTIKYSKGGLT